MRSAPADPPLPTAQQWPVGAVTAHSFGMLDFKRLFARSGKATAPDPDSDYRPSDKAEGLEADYQSLIAGHFRRWGIKPEAVTIEVRRIGQAGDGFDVFVGMVRLTRWERTSAFRLLLGLPLLETKVRKSVRATWLADYSHFAGLWLHCSEQLEVPGELRDLLTTLVPFAPRPPGTAPGPTGYGASSLPPASGGKTSETGNSEPDDRAPVSG